MLQIDHVHIVFLYFYCALSHESLARLMHEHSASKLPAYATAESFYVLALNKLSEDPRIIPAKLDYGTPQYIPRKRKPVIKRNLRSPCDHDSSVTISEARKTKAVPEEESHEHKSQLRTPTRVGSSKSNMSSSGRSNSWCLSSPVEEGKAGKSSQWDFQATARSGLIKTSSGSLLEAPMELTRSVSSMQLLDLPLSVEFGAWQQDDPFNDDSPTNTFKFSTPNCLSPIAQSESEGSPTPKGHKHCRSSNFTPSPSLNQGLPISLFSSTSPYVSSNKSRYSAHCEALQTQLRKHLNETRRLKLETVTLQAERAQQRAQRTLAAGTSKLPSSRSFWSFKDTQAESTERTTRIEKGRATGWSRKRFDPESYANLAHDAIEELRGGI